MQSRTSGARRSIASRASRGDLVAPRVPVALGELVGDVLAEDAHHLAAVGDDRAVIGRLEVELAEADRRLARCAAIDRRLGRIDAVGDRHLGALRPQALRRRGEAAGSGSARRSASSPASARPSPRAARGSRAGRSARPGFEHRQQPLRVGVADHDRRAHPLARLELDPLAGGDRRHRDAGRASRRPRARPARSRTTRGRARPHVAPDRAEAEQIALVVHQPDRRRAGVARPGEGADRALAGDRVVEPPVGDVARRASSAIDSSNTTEISSGSPPSSSLDLLAVGDGRCQRSSSPARSRSRIRSKTSPNSTTPAMSASAKPCPRR